MADILKRLSEIGIVPVIALEDAEQAVPLAKALIAGGLPAAEVTFRTEAGEEAIRRIAQACPEIALGAGTVLNGDQCSRAIRAGAQFIVSPGYDQALVDQCLGEGITVLPGCGAVSDLTRAVNSGLRAVKFFPAEQSGGLAFLRAVAPVFPQLRFMPTGGVNQQNVKEYLAFDRVLGCGGTWMVKKELIRGERWNEITEICRAAVRAALDLQIRSIGLDPEKPAEQALAGLLGWPENDTCEGIVLDTPDVDRAVCHLRSLGVEFDETMQRRDGSGRLCAVGLRQPVLGLRCEIVRR